MNKVRLVSVRTSPDTLDERLLTGEHPSDAAARLLAVFYTWGETPIPHRGHGAFPDKNTSMKGGDLCAFANGAAPPIVKDS